MKTLTFEEFLKTNSERGNDFHLTVVKHDKGVVEFYCHPFNRNGETFDGYVRRDIVSPKKAIDNLLKIINKEEKK